MFYKRDAVSHVCVAVEIEEEVQAGPVQPSPVCVCVALCWP